MRLIKRLVMLEWMKGDVRKQVYCPLTIMDSKENKNINKCEKYKSKVESSLYFMVKIIKNNTEPPLCTLLMARPIYSTDGIILFCKCPLFTQRQDLY